MLGFLTASMTGPDGPTHFDLSYKYILIFFESFLAIFWELMRNLNGMYSGW